MLGLLGLMLTASAAGAWRSNEKAKIAKYEREYEEKRRGTDLSRQYQLFTLYARGVDPQGNRIKEAHKYLPEIRRLVKLQIAKEGLRYYNEGQWNIDNCTFNENNELLTISGKKFDRRLGMVVDWRL